MIGASFLNQKSQKGTGTTLERFLSAPNITYFKCSCKVLVRKPKSASCSDKWSLVGSWLFQEPQATLRCPSKQGPKQLKGSSYPRGEWHFASWTFSPTSQVGWGRWWRVGQRRKEGQGSREWSRTPWATASKQPGEGSGVSCPQPYFWLHVAGSQVCPPPWTSGAISDLSTQITQCLKWKPFWVTHWGH